MEQIFPAPAPAPGAYAALEKYLSLPKKKLNKHKQQDASAGIVSLLVSQPALTYRWIVDSGSSDHMSRDFGKFIEYCPMVPEPVKFVNGATGYALGKGDIALKTYIIQARGYMANAMCILCPLSTLVYPMYLFLFFFL